MNTIRSKRILCVIDNLGSGGAQRQIVNLAIGLKKLGHAAAVFTYSNAPGHFDGELRDAEVPLSNCPRRIGHPTYTILRLRALVQSGKFDGVISFMPIPSFIACVALLGLPTIRLVVSERSSFPTGNPSWEDRMIRALHGRATWVTANSHHQAALMRRGFPRLQERLKTIYNGYDAAQFQVRKWEQASDVLRLVAVGRITTGKNIENLVYALKMSRTQGFDVRLDWIGRLDNVRWASGYYEQISALIDSAGIGSAWRWLGERNDISARLCKYDALVHPSLYEGLPNAVCEAFACGLPVIASNVCDHPVLLVPPQRGFLFNPSDPASIADALMRYACLRVAARGQMGMAARQFALEELSLEKMSSFYSELL